MPRISSQESVEAVKNCRSGTNLTGCVKRTGVCQVPKISSQESVDGVKCVFQARISQRMCRQICVVEVAKISTQKGVEAVINCPSGANFRKDVRADWGY